MITIIIIKHRDTVLITTLKLVITSYVNAPHTKTTWKLLQKKMEVLMIHVSYCNHRYTIVWYHNVIII